MSRNADRLTRRLLEHLQPLASAGILAALGHPPSAKRPAGDHSDGDGPPQAAQRARP